MKRTNMVDSMEGWMRPEKTTNLFKLSLHTEHVLSAEVI